MHLPKLLVNYKGHRKGLVKESSCLLCNLAYDNEDGKRHMLDKSLLGGYVAATPVTSGLSLRSS